MTTNMTVEDRIAERLKSAEFAQWFGEDDLRELTKRALTTAFFQERPNPNGGYNSPKLPPRVVELALNHANSTVDKIVVEEVKRHFSEHPDQLESIIRSAVEGGIEKLITRSIAGMIADLVETNNWNLQERIRQMLTSAR